MPRQLTLFRWQAPASKPRRKLQLQTRWPRGPDLAALADQGPCASWSKSRARPQRRKQGETYPTKPLRTRTDSPPLCVVKRKGGTLSCVTCTTISFNRSSSSSRRNTHNLRLPVKVHHRGGHWSPVVQVTFSSGITSTWMMPCWSSRNVSLIGRPSLKLDLMLSCVKKMSLGRRRRQPGLSGMAAPGRDAGSCTDVPLRCPLCLRFTSTIDHP